MPWAETASIGLRRRFHREGLRSDQGRKEDDDGYEDSGRPQAEVHAHPQRRPAHDRRHDAEPDQHGPFEARRQPGVDCAGNDGGVGPQQAARQGYGGHQTDIDPDDFQRQPACAEQHVGQRRQPDQGQEQQVQPRYGFAEALHVAEHQAVRHPEGADGGKADHVIYDAGAQMIDQACEGAVPVVGRMQFDDQQGDGDGENPVRKEDQTFQIVILFRRFVLFHVSPRR